MNVPESSDIYRRTVPGISDVIYSMSPPSSKSTESFHPEKSSIPSIPVSISNPPAEATLSSVGVNSPSFVKKDQEILTQMHKQIRDISIQEQIFNAQNVKRQERILNEICKFNKDQNMFMTILISVTILSFLLVLITSLYVVIIPMWKGNPRSSFDLSVENDKPSSETDLKNFKFPEINLKKEIL